MIDESRIVYAKITFIPLLYVICTKQIFNQLLIKNVSETCIEYLKKRKENNMQIAKIFA